MPKVTPTALARVGAVAERDMVSIYCRSVRGEGVRFCDEMMCAKDPKSLDPPFVSHFRSGSCGG